MSEIEFERADQEAMDLVNRTASPKAAEAAEQIASELEKAGAVKTMSAEERAALEKEQEEARRLRRRMRWGLAMRLIACCMTAAALLVAMFVPEAIVWVANIGILCAGIVVALSVDRYRFHRRWF